MKKLSVIIPIYKVEKYLCRCIDSILQQTYSNLEIILVDDGSPDNCGTICDAYAEKDSRVKVLHKKNAGVSAARNSGIEMASGEYIAFIDSDDYIASNMFGEMVDLLEKNNLDIISCDAFIAKGDKIIGEAGDGKLFIFEKQEIVEKSLNDCDNNAWGKIYKRQAIGDVRFPEGRLFEDTATAYLFFNNCNRAGHVNKAYYYYYRNPNSITQTAFNTKARMDFVLGYIERLNFALENKLNCVPQCKSLLMKAILSCLTAIYANDADYHNDDNYITLKELIYKYRDKDCYCELSFKYKVFLWCFGRVDFIHKISAKISKASKSLKRL